MILLVGSQGNMGRRYAAIMNHLNIPYYGIDKGETLPNKAFKSIILATPTELHYQHCLGLADLRIPILCEKPVSKDPAELNRLLDYNIDLAMVNQYKWLVDRESSGETYYDYFKSGADGLKWDCINIIGLARGRARLANRSPIWKCSINGHDLSLADMDYAYCRMIEDWWKNPASDKNYVDHAHRKVMEGRW